MLTLLTFYDSMGTSDALWTGFKEYLLWTLYDRTSHTLAGKAVDEGEFEGEKNEVKAWLRSQLKPSIKDD